MVKSIDDVSTRRPTARSLKPSIDTNDQSNVIFYDFRQPQYTPLRFPRQRIESNNTSVSMIGLRNQPSPSFISSFDSKPNKKHFSAHQLQKSLRRLQIEIQGTAICSDQEAKEANMVDQELGYQEIPHLEWCAYCGADSATECEYEASNKTLWSSVAIFLMGGFFGCFLLPYATNNCKEMVVICHKCKRKVR